MLRTCAILVCLALGCSGANAATSVGDNNTVESGSPFVIDPLIPKQALPPGADIHYDFAHVIMPLIVFGESPAKVREQFLGPTAGRFVRTQWAALHTDTPSDSPTSERVSLEVGDAALITMPPPQKNAHAYFALIVFKASGPIRYMTLERSVWMKDDAGDRTVVGEWSIEDGSPVHGNFGEGPKPNREAFLEAVHEYVR